MTAAVGFDGANLLAILTSGRKPRWARQIDPTDTFDPPTTDGNGAPASASAGVATVISGQQSVITNVKISLREDVGFRTVLVTMAALDITATYTVNVDGTAINYATPSDEDDLLIGLRDAILADATVGGAAGANQIVTAECLDSSDAVTTGTVAGGNAATTLRIKGATGSSNYEPDYSIAYSATGTGDLQVVADAVTATARLYVLADDSSLAVAAETPSAWDLVNGTAGVAITRRNWTDRITSAGYQRVYVELDLIAGDGGDGADVLYRAGGGVFVGPCIQE